MPPCRGGSGAEPEGFIDGGELLLRERGEGMYISSIQSVDGQEIIGTTAANATRPPETEAPATVPAAVTTQPATEAVAVTNEDGEAVTDDNGETVTEFVTVGTTAAETETGTTAEQTEE